MTHPNLNIHVKNCDEIYETYAEAAAAGDYALAIHQYLEDEWRTNNLEIVILGGAPVPMDCAAHTAHNTFAPVRRG